MQCSQCSWTTRSQNNLHKQIGVAAARFYVSLQLKRPQPNRVGSLKQDLRGWHTYSDRAVGSPVTLLAVASYALNV